MLPFKEHRSLYFLLIAGFIVRAIGAATLELGNDEVYYRTYALFPDWSHFDHPPMVGYLIQLTTLNLLLSHEFFFRLGPLLSGTVSTYLVYLICLKFGNERRAITGAFLFTGSLYGSIISGLFIMPDAALMPLWLGGLYFIINVVNQQEINGAGKRSLLFAGILIGLATLSKYHAVFLWGGAFLYWIFWDRKWLAVKETYLAVLLSIVCIFPVLWWNIQHDFISFRFQGERVSFFEHGLRPDRFFTELGGQIFYNNPFNFILTVIAVAAIFRRKEIIELPQGRLILASALPLIAFILFFSLFRKTLPHWSGPAYVTLIPLTAAYVTDGFRRFPMKMVSASVSLLFFILMAGTLEVNYGIITGFTSKQAKNIEKQGKHDVTLDMYGWNQFAEHFNMIVQNDLETGKMTGNSPLIAQKWFTAAHLDYYVAAPLNKKLLAFGTLDDIHKFAWINMERGLPEKGTDAYYITNSREFRSTDALNPYFESIDDRDTIPILRMGNVAEYFFIYRLRGYKGNFDVRMPQ